jgi:hypothetical protein
MRVLIQDTKNLKYLKSLGIWTAESKDALIFRNSVNAVHYCKANALENVQILLQFPDKAVPIAAIRPE